MMNGSIYINGIGNISAQQTFESAENYEIIDAQEGFFNCLEPKYKQYIERKLLRRMSRVVKMGLAASYKALNEATNPEIHAIITGSAWGCVGDTEKFLTTLIENQEDYLTPTAFVQSTHNTVAGQIALMHKLNCYNMTYVQGDISFESALIDAILKFEEGGADNILVGGIDEQTDKLKVLFRRLNCANDSRKMGEGSTFFVLSNSAQSNTYAILKHVSYMHTAKSDKNNFTFVKNALQQSELKEEEIDLILCGDSIKNLQEAFPSTQLFNYKSICGAYPTSTAFATAFAAELINNSSEIADLLNINQDKLNNILIFNESENKKAVIVLSKP